MKASRLIIAALFAGALIVSCNKEIEQETVIVPNSPVLQSECVISIDATKAVTSKALAESSDGKTLNATWEDGDAVAVCLLTGDPDNPISEVIGKLTPKTTGDATTKLEGTIVTTGLTNGSWLYLQFPYKVYTDAGSKTWTSSWYNAVQDGTLATIASKYDYATCGVQVTAIDGDVLSTTKAEFVSRQAVVKFNFKNADGSAPVSFSKVRLQSSFASNFWHDKYFVTNGVIIAEPSAPASEYYFALHKNNDGVIWIFGVGSDNVYSKRTPDVAFDDGKFYTANVKMEPMCSDDYTYDSPYAICGKMSAYDNNWDKDLNMWTNGADSHVAASVNLKAGDELKFRTIGKWSGSEGGEDWGANITSIPDVTWITPDNIVIPADGVYDLYLNLSGRGPNVIIAPANGSKASKVMVKGWSIVGLGGDWNNDIVATQNGSKWTLTDVAVAAGDEFKWRKDGSFTLGNYGGYFYNYGEPFDAVEGGDNIVIPDAGVYDIELDLTNPSAPKITVKVPDVYTVAGAPAAIFGTEWADDLATNDMIRQSDGTYLKTYSVTTLPSSPIQFKVVKGHVFGNAGENNWPVDNYVYNIPQTGLLHIWFDPESKNVEAWMDDFRYSIAGDFNVWDMGAAFMTEDIDGTFKCIIPSVTAGTHEFKLVIGQDKWQHDGPNDQFTVSSPCDVEITYDPATGNFSFKEIRVTLYCRPLTAVTNELCISCYALGTGDWPGLAFTGSEVIAGAKYYKIQFPASGIQSMTLAISIVDRDQWNSKNTSLTFPGAEEEYFFTATSGADLVLLPGRPAEPSITIDGNFADWADVVGADKRDDYGKTTTTMKAFSDGTVMYVYAKVAIDSDGTVGLDSNSEIKLFFDKDNKATTGSGDWYRPGADDTGNEFRVKLASEGLRGVLADATYNPQAKVVADDTNRTVEMEIKFDVAAFGYSSTVALAETINIFCLGYCPGEYVGAVSVLVP